MTLSSTQPLLDVQDVTRDFSIGGLLSRRHVRAVDGVSFSLSADRPEIFTIIGESGSGKSTLARMILNLDSPTRGAIRLQGRDLTAIRGSRGRLALMRTVQPIFQNPFETFNPLKRVDRYLFATARRIAGLASLDAAQASIDQALRQVGLSLAEIRQRYPHELSGGQLQRIAIARALIARPALIVADEPVSMVDASLRTSIVTLLRRLCDDMRVSIIYITHDLATAYHIGDRIIIMRGGRVVESGETRSVLDNPQHPYSLTLKAAVLSPDAA